MTSLLYDIAGRSEDAFNLTWERIEYSEQGGGYASLAKGKTSFRKVTFSPRTEELLRELGGPGSPTGPLFAFASANSMAKWLGRRIKKIALPEGNTIAVDGFQSHNLRASKLTWLSQVEKWTDAEIQRFSGHASIVNLYRYIKVDEAQNLDRMLRAEQKKAAEGTG